MIPAFTPDGRSVPPPLQMIWVQFDLETWLDPTEITGWTAIPQARCAVYLRGVNEPVVVNLTADGLVAILREHVLAVLDVGPRQPEPTSAPGRDEGKEWR